MEGRDEITAEDLRISAIGMQRHMALLAPKAANQSHAEKFAEAFVGLIGNAVFKGDNDNATEDDVRIARDHVLKAITHAHREINQVRSITSAGADSAQKTLEQGKITHVKLETIKEQISRI